MKLRIQLTIFSLCFWAGCIFFLLNSTAGAAPSPESKAYQRLLIRSAHSIWGLNAPVSLFAAQVQAESSWRPSARSRYASGLTQFTPATAKWLAKKYPHLGPAQPLSPGWAIRAMLTYNRHLYRRVKPWRLDQVPRCDHLAFMLMQYNGGPSWLNRDRKKAQAAGAHPDLWWGHTERYTNRAVKAERENRNYPRKILFTLEPQYRAAGWPGHNPCGVNA